MSDQVAEQLDKMSEILIECRCSKKRVKFWKRILLDDFQRTDIMNLPQVRETIVEQMPRLVRAVSSFVTFRDNEPLSSKKLWKMYEVLGNTTAPEVVKLKQHKNEVRETFLEVAAVIDSVIKRSEAKK